MSPQYALLYDIDYRMRQLDARLCKMQAVQANASAANGSEPSNAAISLITDELTLMAIQLNVWIASRGWAPITPQTRRIFLQRGHAAVSVLSSWLTADRPRQKEQFDAQWLIWVLAMICACSLELGFETEQIPMRQLARVVQGLEIASLSAFVDCLSQWPMTEDWHRRAFEMLWAEIDSGDGDGDDVAEGKRIKWNRAASGFWIGPLEFYGH